MSPGNKTNSHVIIGQISGLYGVHGGLKVFSYTSPRERIFLYSPWLLKIGAIWSSRNVLSGQGQGKGLVVFLEGVTDRDKASALVGVQIAVERQQLPPLAAGEFYWSDLFDMEVVDLQGRVLGKVVNMQETGANDVLVVQGERKFMLPWVMREVVQQVDMDAGRIVVDWDPEYQ